MVALCSLLNARHLLYGPLLSRFLPAALRGRLKIAFLLTDEVFATAFNRLQAVDPARRQGWMTALGLGAWLTWIAGTAVGVYAGDGLERHYPCSRRSCVRAKLALFMALVCQSAKRGMGLPIVAAVAGAGAVAALGHTSAAILAGAVIGCVAYRLRRPA